MNNRFLNKEKRHSIITNTVIIIIFALISVTYFAPSVFEGKTLHQADVIGASGTGRDAKIYKEQTGKTSYWTNSLFGGMPTYQIAPSYPSNKGLSRAEKLITLRFPINILSGDSWLLFALMIGFFIFMQSMNISKMLSILGSIAWAFSSYFIILIIAGHIWKLETLAFVPPTIAGLIWAYRGKYLKGLVVMGLFASLQIFGNHIQMSYYFAFVMLFIAISFIIKGLKEKQYNHILKATSICVLAGVIAIATNSTNLYHTYKFSKETMRSGSELTNINSSTSKNDVGGLSSDYITQWSYGKAETLTLFIPNLYGGASIPLGLSKEANFDKTPYNIKQYVQSISAYWGEQPFTAGPVYVGAFVFFLFLCGCFCVKGNLKWALLIATIFSILLSWGHNFMWLTDLFIRYVPLYNKFRAVSSILVIAEFTIPTLAIMCLAKFLASPKEFVKTNKSGIITSLVMTLGISLLLVIIPSIFFNFISSQEAQTIKDNFNNPLYSNVFTEVANVRRGLLVGDAMRSAFIIIISIIPLLYYYYTGGKHRNYVIILLIIISFCDLWNVDKRYLNYDSFQDDSTVVANANPETYADKMLEQDKGLHYRVLNLSLNTFNDATTSFRHRSVGGYSAVKLQRFQDIIDRVISKNVTSPVLDMLDTKYYIVRDSVTGTRAVLNPNHYGAAWFVDNIKWVDNADEEMQYLENANELRSIAIVDKRFQKDIDAHKIGVADSTDFIKLESYNPNRITYNVNLKYSRICVFSDIYYPDGWILNANNKNINLFRADYILRAAQLPAGHYILTMTFYPSSINITEIISFTALIILALIIVFYIMIYVKELREQINNKNI